MLAQGVAVDSTGRVYVSDGTTNSVIRYDAAGTNPSTVATGFSYPYGIAFVGPIAQSPVFGAAPPAADAVVGNTYTVAATGGGSGNAVTFSRGSATTSSACTVSGTTVTFTHAGSCVVEADQAASSDGTYAAGSSTLTVSVGQAATTTTVSSTTTTVDATVAVSSPGAGSPTGTVDFTADGQAIGSAPVSNGTATLAYAAPSGRSVQLTATYHGSSDFAASSGSATATGPSTPGAAVVAGTAAIKGGVVFGSVPTLTCTSTGGSTCSITTTRTATTVSYAATVTNAAGHTTTTTTSYPVLDYVARGRGVTYRDGAFVVSRGTRVRIAVLTGSGVRPILLAPGHRRPGAVVGSLNDARTLAGRHHWTRNLSTTGLRPGRYVVGVRVGADVHRIVIRVVG